MGDSLSYLDNLLVQVYIIVPFWVQHRFTFFGRIRPKPTHLHSLIPSTWMSYFLISLATTAVFPTRYIVPTSIID